MAMSSGIPGSVRRKVMRRDRYTCRACLLVGREEQSAKGNFSFPTDVKGVYLSIDHIHPRSLGGGYEMSNLRVLCVPCNTRKGTKVEAPSA